MKRFFMTAICVVAIVSLQAQMTLDVKNISVGQYSYPVILPSKENLIKLVNCDVESFKATMKKYNYHPKDKYVGTDYCYDNWHLMLWMHGNNGKGANTYTLGFTNDGTVCSCDIPSSAVWPEGYIADWHRSMMPYNIRSDGKDETYLYETTDAYYGFFLQFSKDSTQIRITIKKFPK